MRTFHACLLLAVLVGPAVAADRRHPEDATLRAVQFVDDREGWAVGDEGVIWHTIDGGKTWERQPSGTAGSLRSVHFVDPYIGWVAGREELPGGGASGVVLYTTDGGLKWRRILLHSLPGLNLVRFVGPKVGYLAGDGSEQFPSGVFTTTDAGRSWQPVPGPRASSWRGGDFDAEGGALGGAWNRLATVRRGQVFAVEMDTLGGRAMTGLTLQGGDGVAVGQGGLVLLAQKSRGSSWDKADLRLPREVIEALDLHAVAMVGPRIWAVGKPGSAVLLSPDSGKTWSLSPTGQPMPLHGVYFRDDRRGWAVGELGTVLTTGDGGNTWQVQQRGGQRMAVLCVHARAGKAALDMVTHLGGHDGYLAAGLCVAGPEPASAETGRVGEASRLNEAFRQAGGVTASQMWQFPVGSHLARSDRAKLLGAWDRLHDDRAAQQLLGQLVLALRTYRPDVVLTDGGDDALAAVVAEAAKEAFKQAGDPAAFTGHLKALGLSPWKARKLYTLSAKGTVVLDQTAMSARLGTTVREAGTPPALLLGQGVPPSTRGFTLLAADLTDAGSHTSLMQGIALAPGGVARRPMDVLEELAPEKVSAVRKRMQLWAMAEAPDGMLANPEKMMSNLGATVADMPDDVGARVAHGLGRLYAGRGQWSAAREAFFVLVERYPTHPLAVDGYRWLLMHQSSGEVRRRYELGQFVVHGIEQHGAISGRAAPKGPSLLTPEKGRKGLEVPTFETTSARAVAHLNGHDDVKKWLQGVRTLERKLSAFGPLYAGDARVGFCVQAARRQLGEVEEARKWYRDFASRQPAGPWRDLAVGELWLASRSGTPPRPVLYAPPAERRPYLDGKLDDECWRTARPVALKNAGGGSVTTHPTEARMTYDRDYLYLAVRCVHPRGESVPAKKPRTRDEDLRAYDRVSLMLDVDRDYNTCWHLQVDARGCVAEDCWGDRSWSPKWFVAVHRDESSWTVEAAIPRTMLRGDAVTPGQAWAVNVVRTVPGTGVQAFSLPAEAPETAVRPEGLGLLLFTGDEHSRAERK